MALTVTSRGTGTHNTAATTLVPGGRTATLAAGSMGVLCIALDNAGASGASVIAPASWTDAKGNVWTRRTNALFDNGAASAGIEMVFYTAPITVALLTTDLGTITWSSGSPVAKAWTWYEVIPSGSNTVSYSTGGSIAGAAAANATVVTASVAVGDAVIAGYFSENVNAVTGDSDTTNGSWTAQQTATVGSGTSGVRVATQQKVQTTTDSTQSYDVTVASQDRIAGYIMLHEVVNTTVTPPQVDHTLTTFAPTVTAASNVTVAPGVATLTTVTFAPTVVVPRLIVPALVALTLTAFAPTVTASDVQTVTPVTATVTSSPFVPTVTVSDNQVAVPGAAAVTVATFAPDVTASANLTATPATTTLSTGPFAPTVTASANVSATPGVAALTLTPYAPTVTGGGNQLVTPDVAGLTAATFAPTVTSNAGVTVTPGTATLTVTPGAAPTVVTPNVVTPNRVALAVSTFAPTVTAGSPPRDITVTASLGAGRYVATLTVRATASTLGTPRYSGALATRSTTGTVHARRWEGTL